MQGGDAAGFASRGAGAAAGRAAALLAVAGCGAEAVAPPERAPTPEVRAVAPDAARPVDAGRVDPLEQRFLDEGLVDLAQAVVGLRVDLRYSTVDNFLGVDVYGGLEKAYLREVAAARLATAQALLRDRHPGWSLVVFDAARPRHVQALMWDALDLPNKQAYVAPPWKGSVHSTGCAVDLSIVDDAGRPVDMGTAFDHFGPEAQPRLEARMLADGRLDATQVRHRRLLRDVMTRAGFRALATEWWHFDAADEAGVAAGCRVIP